MKPRIHGNGARRVLGRGSAQGTPPDKPDQAAVNVRRKSPAGRRLPPPMSRSGQAAFDADQGKKPRFAGARENRIRIVRQVE